MPVKLGPERGAAVVTMTMLSVGFWNLFSRGLWQSLELQV